MTPTALKKAGKEGVYLLYIEIIKLSTSFYINRALLLFRIDIILRP